MEAQDKLTKLAVEKEKVSMTLAEKESKKKNKKEVESQPAEQSSKKIRLHNHKLAIELKNGLLIMNGLDLTEY